MPTCLHQHIWHAWQIFCLLEVPHSARPLQHPLYSYFKGSCVMWYSSTQSVLGHGTWWAGFQFCTWCYDDSCGWQKGATAKPFCDQQDIYAPLTNSLCKSAGIPVSHFSMLPSTLKYLYSVKLVRMHFPVKQASANDTQCSAAWVTCCCDVLWANFECFFSEINMVSAFILSGLLFTMHLHAFCIGECFPDTIKNVYLSSCKVPVILVWF